MKSPTRIPLYLVLCCLAAACPGGDSFVTGFSSGLNGWNTTSPEEFSIDRNGGRNETQGLRINREKSANYNIIGHPVKAVPGKSYEFSYWIKTRDVQGATGMRAGIEFYARKPDGSKEYLFPPAYSQGISGTNDWTQVVVKIPRVPLRTETVSLIFFMGKKTTGTAWIDDVAFRPATPPLVATMIHPAGQAAAPGETVTLRFVRENGEVLPDSPGRTVRVKIGDSAPEFPAPVAKSIAQFRVPELPDGEYPLSLTLGADTLRLPLQIRRKPGKTTFSPTGAMLIDGKKFMPLGFITYGTQEKVIQRLKEAGGNVVMPYCSLGIGKGRKGVREALDRLERENIKIIFSLKDVYAGVDGGVTQYDGIRGDAEVAAALVNALKDHPALLAWYVNDELNFSPMLVNRRDLLARLDPDHPAWAAQYQYDEMPVYARITDVLGVESYPVNKLSPEKSSISAKTESGAFRTKAIGIPVWAVPQIHNLGVYNPSEFRSYRSPNGQEMRTVSLFLAGVGAKGFIFYMLDDLWNPKYPDPEANFNAVWPDVVATFRELRELEPFILSDVPVEELKLSGVEGRVRAFRLRNGDDERILVTALGPGKSQATLAAAGKKFRSRYGRCSQTGDRLVFHGTGIDSDVLIPE